MVRVKSVIVAFVFSCCGCAHPGDDMSSLIVADLASVGRRLSSFSFDQCARVNTLEDAVSVLQEKRRMSAFDRGCMREDRLGRPYLFARSADEDSVFMRVSSAGPNQQFENGSGDDLVLEVTVTKGNDGTFIILEGGRLIRSSASL